MNGDIFDNEEEYYIFRVLELLLLKNILIKNIVIVIITLINSGYIILKKNFKGDYIIIKEINKVNNGELFVTLI